MQVHDRFTFGWQDGVHAAAGTAISKIGTVTAKLHPAPRPGVVNAQAGSGLSWGPARVDGVIDQVEQAGLDGCVHTRRDRASVQSQRAFPSAK